MRWDSPKRAHVVRFEHDTTQFSDLVGQSACTFFKPFCKFRPHSKLPGKHTILLFMGPSRAISCITKTWHDDVLVVYLIENNQDILSSAHWVLKGSSFLCPCLAHKIHLPPTFSCSAGFFRNCETLCIWPDIKHESACFFASGSCMWITSGRETRGVLTGSLQWNTCSSQQLLSSTGCGISK